VACKKGETNEVKKVVGGKRKIIPQFIQGASQAFKILSVISLGTVVTVSCKINTLYLIGQDGGSKTNTVRTSLDTAS
jgi:hypothetical protein